jgi:fatty-acyl-CoA synthase
MVVDPDKLDELPQGEVGEILVAGPQIMAGYWQRPDATEEVFVARDGKTFLRTGDLGYVDGEGYFFVVDRLTRMINVSGFKVWPAECEALLYRHEAVRECCIISVPDAYRGETVKAMIALHPAYEGKVTAKDIEDFARTVMAGYKVPRLIEFVKTLPRSGSNKIDWRKVQDMERSKVDG